MYHQGEYYIALNEMRAGSSPINVIGVVTSYRGIHPTRNGGQCSDTIRFFIEKDTKYSLMKIYLVL